MVRFEEILAAYGPEKKNESLFSQMIVDASQTRALVPLQRDEALYNMRSGFEWHNNMIRLVASCVREGLTLNETLDVMKDVTLPGYSPHETVGEISTAYEGAKRKGYDRDALRPHERLEAPIKKCQPFLQWLHEISDTEPQFLVEAMIEERSLALVFGRPASGKSFFAVDVAASISTGEPFQGLKVQKGDVVYIAGEGHRGLRRRFDAWAKHHEINQKDIRVMISRSAVNYRDEDAAKELEEELIEAQKKGLEPSLFVIDTLARNYGDGDENSNADMSRFIRVVDSFNDKFGCATLIVHHSGHSDSQRGRGASSLKGALDTEFLCAKKDDAILVTCTKMKDFEAPADLYLKLTSVELGTTSNGKPVESAVLTKTNGTVARSTITPSIRRNLRVFCEAATEYGGKAMLNKVVLEYRVSLENWRKVFYRSATQDTAEAKRKAFERARKELVQKGHLEVYDDMYLLKSPEAGQTG
jgi:hypothetical protein